MVTVHLDKFNDGINAHGRKPEEYAEHDSVLWHEGKMYDLIKEYVSGVGYFSPEEMDYALRNIRWHIESILEFVGLDISSDCVMYEAIDVQSARMAA